MGSKSAEVGPAELVRQLEQVCGRQQVSARPTDLISCARDMWPRSLLRQRAGNLDSFPQVVVWPADANQVSGVVKIARRLGVPLVPFGAGSGVCGGTLPVKGGVLLDLKRLDRIQKLDEESGLLEVEAGALGEPLERELNRRGWTGGHFPSSLQCSTVGGWVAARGAGQCSSRYGKVEDLVRGLTFVNAQGGIERISLSPAGAGWSVLPLLVGSEGTLGVITSATLVLRRLAQQRWLRGFRFTALEGGLEAMRLMLRDGLRPAVLRLYDEFDSMVALGKHPGGEETESLLSRIARGASGPMKSLFSLSLPYLLRNPWLLNRAAGLLPKGCLLVVVQEGGAAECRLAAEHIAAIGRNLGATDLGPEPAEHWLRHRYDISYRQSGIFSAGAFVDTMEVATTWERLPGLYHAVRQAVERLAFVMAHFSHAYREGCSIYFTFAGADRDDDNSIARYDRIWDAAQHAVRDQGGIVSHHHGIGVSKVRYLMRQMEGAAETLKTVKQVFDPQGLFNPDKLGLGATPAESTFSGPAGRPSGSRRGEDLGNSVAKVLGPAVLESGNRKEFRRLGLEPVCLLAPRDAGELCVMMKEAAEQKQPLAICGSGTRTAPTGSIFRGPVISTLALDSIEAIEPKGLYALAGAGTRLERLEVACRRHGLQLAAPARGGTLGGWLAAGAGFTDPVIGLRVFPVLALEVVLPSGKLVRTVPSPRAATGPELMSLWLGTRGCLGVLSRAWVKLEPQAEASAELAAAGRSPRQAVELLRRLARDFFPPREAAAVIRPVGGGWQAAARYAGKRELVEAAADFFREAAKELEADPLPDGEAAEILDQDAAAAKKAAFGWSELLTMLGAAGGAVVISAPGQEGCLASGIEPARPDNVDSGFSWLEKIRACLDPEGRCNARQWDELLGRER